MADQRVLLAEMCEISELSELSLLLFRGRASPMGSGVSSKLSKLLNQEDALGAPWVIYTRRPPRSARECCGQT
jgi:hypothetical protein